MGLSRRAVSGAPSLARTLSFASSASLTATIKSLAVLYQVDARDHFCKHSPNALSDIGGEANGGILTIRFLLLLLPGLVRKFTIPG